MCAWVCGCVGVCVCVYSRGFSLGKPMRAVSHSTTNAGLTKLHTISYFENLIWITLLHNIGSVEALWVNP